MPWRPSTAGWLPLLVCAGLRASLRMLFNPSRTLSNTAQGRSPWYRPTRDLLDR